MGNEELDKYLLQQFIIYVKQLSFRLLGDSVDCFYYRLIEAPYLFTYSIALSIVEQMFVSNILRY